MNRRDLMKMVAAILPAAAVRIEPEVQSTDLIVVEHPGDLSNQEAEELHRAVGGRFSGPIQPMIVVLGHGAHLRIEHGVARLEHVHPNIDIEVDGQKVGEVVARRIADGVRHHHLGGLG